MASDEAERNPLVAVEFAATVASGAAVELAGSALVLLINSRRVVAAERSFRLVAPQTQREETFI